MLTTQLFIAGEPQNERDGILRRMGDAAQQASVVREFQEQAGSDGDLVATWDIVIGGTPEDPGQRRGPGRGRRGGPPPGQDDRPGNGGGGNRNATPPPPR